MSAAARASKGPTDGSSKDGASNDGASNEGPSKYAPKRARLPEQDQNLQNLKSAPPTLEAEPPWKRKGQPGAFTGDVAMAELRGQQSLMPDGVPEPPTGNPPTHIFGAKKRIVGVIALMVGGAAGYIWGYAPPATAPEQSSSVGAAERAMPATPPLLPAAAPEPRAQAALPRLTVDAVRWWHADEPAPLTISSA